MDWEAAAVFQVQDSKLRTHQATAEWKVSPRVLTLPLSQFILSLVLPAHSPEPPATPRDSRQYKYRPTALPSSHSTSLPSTVPTFQSHPQETAMNLKINPFGWGTPTHDVKEDAAKKDVDSKAVTAQLDALRDSVNGTTAALDSLPARIVAEIQLNDPKKDVSSQKHPKCNALIALGNIYGRQHAAKQRRLAARRTCRLAAAKTSQRFP